MPIDDDGASFFLVADHARNSAAMFVPAPGSPANRSNPQ
jgi:hypothetical protein